MGPLRTGSALAVTLAVVLFAAPPGRANHGDNAVYMGQGPPTVLPVNDCSMTFVGTYRFGNFEFQTWSFDIHAEGARCSVHDSCDGLGSIESGFAFSNCYDAALGGTGDFHAYPHQGLDNHAVSMRLQNVPGEGTVAVVR